MNIFHGRTQNEKGKFVSAIYLMRWGDNMQKFIIAILVLANIYTLGLANEACENNKKLAAAVLEQNMILNDFGKQLIFYTHPKTIMDRTCDYVLGKGEFEK